MSGEAMTRGGSRGDGWTRLGALVITCGGLAALLWWLVGSPLAVLGVPDGGHIRDVLSGADLQDDDVVRVTGTIAWLVLAYLAASIVLRSVLLLASSLTHGAGWTQAALHVTGPLTLPVVRHLVDGALAGVLVVSATLQPELAMAHAVMSTAESSHAVVQPVRITTDEAAGPAGLAQADTPTPPQADSYTVVPGDSLWGIADHQLGDGFRWVDIWQLNVGREMPDGRQLTNPNLIYPGWTLQLPQDDSSPSQPPTSMLPDETQPAAPATVAPSGVTSPSLTSTPTSSAPSAVPAGGATATSGTRHRTRVTPDAPATPIPAQHDGSSRFDVPDVPASALVTTGAAALAAGALLLVFRRRRVMNRKRSGERVHAGAGDAGRVFAVARLLSGALADMDFADARILLVRETGSFVEFRLVVPPGDASALVAARHQLARLVGCAIDGEMTGRVQVRLRLSRVSRLAGELFGDQPQAPLLIVPVGASDGGVFYLNLAACGSGLVVGDHLAIRDLLTSWLATLASFSSPEDLAVIPDAMAEALIGAALDAFSQPETSRPTLSTSDLARDLEARMTEDLGVSPNVATLVLAGPVSDVREATDELRAVLRQGRQDGLFVVVTTEGPVDGATLSGYGAVVTFEADDDDLSRVVLQCGQEPAIELEPVLVRRQVLPQRHRNPEADSNPPTPVPEVIDPMLEPSSDEPVFPESPADSLPVSDAGEIGAEPSVPNAEPLTSTVLPPATNGAADPVMNRQSALPLDGPDDNAGRSNAPLFRVTCFRAFRVETAVGEVSGWTIQKARELLAFLVARGGSPVPRETVAEALWPEGDLDQVGHQLSNAAYYLRRALSQAAGEMAGQVLVTANQRYHLRTGLFQVDVDAFDAHLARADRLAGYDALVEYERTLALYTGDFLEDELYEWAEVYRRDFRRRFVASAHRAARLASEARDHELAQRFYEAILVRDPIDEEAVRGVMRSQAARGDTNAMRRSYRQLAAALQHELEDDAAEPLPETTKLRDELLGERHPHAALS